MARMARKDVFSPDEIAIVHVMNRVVRQCFLMGTDELTGKNFDHRKVWIEDLLEHYAGCFGLDLLCYTILSNHFHLVLRSRPDVVATWDDTEVARRWLLLCPVRKHGDGSPKAPNEAELNTIRNDAERLVEIRSRLSDISWWMRFLCQRIAIRANLEDEQSGKFWESRFRAVRLLDEESLLACAAYVDLNAVRAAIAETLEESNYSSVQRRIQAMQGIAGADEFLAPLSMDERIDSPGPCPSEGGHRCSELGFLPMKLEYYLQLLDWTAREVVTGKRGATPVDVPPVLERLSLQPSAWCELVNNFGQLFYNVAGRPQTVESCRSRVNKRRFHLRREARQILSAVA